MFFVKYYEISILLFIYLLTVCDISYGKPWPYNELENPAARSSRSMWDDLFSYFDDTSEEEDESSEELFDKNPQDTSDQNRKYELCRDCNISYLNVNSTQYINHYNQVTTEKANALPTPDSASKEKATKNGATTTKDTTQTTVSPKAMIITTTTPIITTTTSRASKDIVQADVDSDEAATPTATTIKATTTTTTSTTTTTTTPTTVSATTKSVDMTIIPPAPVPLDEEPLLEPSDKMPSEEALTSEENV